MLNLGFFLRYFVNLAPVRLDIILLPRYLLIVQWSFFRNQEQTKKLSSDLSRHKTGSMCILLSNTNVMNKISIILTKFCKSKKC